MLHRCWKKCSEIFKVASVGGCHCIFFLYEALGKKAFFWILKTWSISWIASQNVQRMQISTILVSFLWGNLNMEKMVCGKNPIQMLFFNTGVYVRYIYEWYHLKI